MKDLRNLREVQWRRGADLLTSGCGAILPTDVHSACSSTTDSVASNSVV